MTIKSGIYRITNLIPDEDTKTCKIYIGSSVNLKSRKCAHFNMLRRNKHANGHLQNAYNKYGEDNFKWEMIELVPKIGDMVSLKKDLLCREQFYLNLYKSYIKEYGYNIRYLAENNSGTYISEKAKEKLRRLRLGKKLSEETKKRMSESRKGNTNSVGRILSEEHKRKIRESNTGKIFTEESRKKMRESRLGKKLSEETKEKMRGRIYSEETRKKIGESSKGRKHSEEAKKRISESLKNMPEDIRRRVNETNVGIRVINLTTGETFDSALQASLFYGMKTSSHIGSACKGIRKTAGGFSWGYLQS